MSGMLQGLGRSLVYCFAGFLVESCAGLYSDSGLGSRFSVSGPISPGVLGHRLLFLVGQGCRSFRSPCEPCATAVLLTLKGMIQTVIVQTRSLERGFRVGPQTKLSL